MGEGGRDGVFDTVGCAMLSRVRIHIILRGTGGIVDEEEGRMERPGMIVYQLRVGLGSIPSTVLYCTHNNLLTLLYSTLPSTRLGRLPACFAYFACLLDHLGCIDRGAGKLDGGGTGMPTGRDWGWVVV